MSQFGRSRNRDGAGGAGSPNPEIGSVRILPLPTDHNLHVGDTYQLEANVEDVRGRDLPDAEVNWMIDPAASYAPPYASVTKDGLLSIESPMNFSLRIVAASGGVSDEAFESIRGWGFEEDVDPISGRSYALASLGANIGAEGRPRLHLRCEDDDLDLYISVTFVTGSGWVRYRIGDGSERVESWQESSDFDAVFYPGDPSALVDRLAAADTVLFALDKFGAGEVVATFIRRGLPISTRRSSRPAAAEVTGSPRMLHVPLPPPPTTRAGGRNVSPPDIEPGSMAHGLPHRTLERPRSGHTGPKARSGTRIDHTLLFVQETDVAIRLRGYCDSAL